MSAAARSGEAAVRWLVPLGIFCVTVLAFLPATRCGFVWDDGWVLVSNPEIRGFSPDHVRWMFEKNNMPHYFPLTLLSFALDYALWGLNPSPFHWTNVLLHALAASAFYFLARRLLEAAAPKPLSAETRVPATIGAACAALLFSIHPLRVESVAYVTERCDPLSGLLFIASLLCYLTAAEIPLGSSRRRPWLAASVAVYALSLLSKEIGVTLPVTLLILDVYPLRRYRSNPRGALWLEKLPYFVLALASGLAALNSQASNHNLIAQHGHWVAERLSQAVYSYAFYLSKTICPLQLSPIYQARRFSGLLDPLFAASTAVLLLITGLLVKHRRDWPWALAAWAYYVVTLAPVSGIVQYGPQLIADRYSYLSCMSWAVLAGGGAAALGRSRFRPRTSGSVLAAAACAAGLLLFFGRLTWTQAAIWRDSLSLLSRVVSVYPDSYWAEAGVGGALHQQGRLDDAIAHWRRSLALNPDNDDVRVDVSLALAEEGKVSEAVDNFPRDLHLIPEAANAVAYFDMGRALAAHGGAPEAIRYLRKAADSDPGNAAYRSFLEELQSVAPKEAKD